jgi:regulator of cell morphogenesis and NO signaling
MVFLSSFAITQFYSDDHRRLDGLLNTHRALNASRPKEAQAALEQFKAGLEQHMAWEEAILFPAYDAVVPPENRRTSTTIFQSEHEQIRDCLEIIFKKIRDGAGDTEKESARLAALLEKHNRDEEADLYLPLDKGLTESSRAEIYRHMWDSEWASHNPKGGL